MALPDPVFSHIDHLAEVHRYGALALKAAKVQDFINYYELSPELPEALAETFRRLTPADFTTDFKEAFDVDISQLPETETRLLVFYVLSGRLPLAVSRSEEDKLSTRLAEVLLPLALATLQTSSHGGFHRGLSVLRTVRLLLESQ